MKLRKNISYTDFLDRVDKCENDVFYKTLEGDIINLKSQLSKYLFLVAINAPGLSEGEIEMNGDDYRMLEEFLDAGC